MVVGLVVVAAVAVYVGRLWEENARLREQSSGGAKPTVAANQTAKPTAPAAAPAATGPVVGGRSLDEDHAKAMKQVLESSADSPKKAWVQVQTADREAGAYAAQLANIFKDAGWEVTITTISRMNIKAGLFFFSADEEPPHVVDTALEALRAAGIEPTAATGYRAYADEKKKENPKWVGIELEPNQPFALVVGPKPAS